MVGDDAAFETVMKLLVGVEAAAAVGAELAGATEGVDIPDSVREPLRAVTRCAAPGLDDVPLVQRRALLGAIRARFRQAADLLDHCARAPGWTYTDPQTIDGQGRASGMFAPMLAAELTRVGPRATGPRQILDIGTGAAWLAIGLARAVTDARVVGIDIWPPSLELAHRNVAAEGLGDRVEIRECDVVTLADRDRFDAAWMPGPFLPRAILDDALARVHASLRTGGVVMFGMFAGADDPTSRALDDLRTIRSGGHPFTPTTAIALLESAGFTRVHEAPRTWSLPVRLVLAIKP